MEDIQPPLVGDGRTLGPPPATPTRRSLLTAAAAGMVSRAMPRAALEAADMSFPMRT